jgi:amino acid adenylation domain-containing protein
MNKVEFDPTLVHEWLRRSARRFPDKEALICGKRRLSYGVLDRSSDHLAAALNDIQVRRHDRVVILLDDSSESVISLYGILKAGGVFIILAGSVKGAKLRYIMENSEADVLITHTSKAGVVVDALSRIRRDIRIIWVGPKSRIPNKFTKSSESWDEIFSSFGSTVENTQKNNQPSLSIDVDLAALIYTSGSTGEPKGVMCTHHNMVSAARSIIQYIENNQNDIILNSLPLSYGYGLYQVIMAFMFGGTVILEPSFIYLHNILSRIAEEKVTGFPIVPTMAAMLLKMCNPGEYDISSLRYLTSAGAALPVEHIRSLQKLMPHIRIFSMYGLTECIRVSYLSPDELGTKPASVGKAMPNCEVFIVDRDGSEVTSGRTGELVIRGSNVTQGYWKDPDLTSKTYRHSRYPAERVLYSGDYFRKDDSGFLYFLGRQDDMIKSRGERINAGEIENTLCALDGVAEAGVIGVPDVILGQAVKAYVIVVPSCGLTEKEVMKYCVANMETFMVPKYIEFVDKLPVTANGKIDKKKLKSMEAKPVWESKEHSLQKC